MNLSDLMSLPTDSLYKFMAFCGMLILCGSAVASFYVKKVIFFSCSRLLADAEILKERAEYMSRRVKAVTGESEASGYGREMTPEQSNEWMESARELAEYQLELLETQIKIKHDYNKIDFLRTQSQTLKYFLYVAPSIGISLVLWGFFLWYWKLQRFLDLAVSQGLQP